MNQLPLKNIGIFCGSNSGTNPCYTYAARALVDIFIERDITLIYGGAKVGLMGTLADTMLSYGGHVVGVIPQSLMEIEIAHHGLSHLHIVNTLHERQELMAQLSDAFIMLPGGPGSLDGFFEMLTWSQLGIHTKPCGILNTNRYYDPLLTFLDHIVSEGFFQQIHRDMILVSDSPTELIHLLLHYQPPAQSRWFVPALPSAD